MPRSWLILTPFGWKDHSFKSPWKWNGYASHNEWLLLCRFFVGYGLEISRIVPLIIFHIKRKYLCKTERELEEAWAPGPFSYHTSVPADLLILIVTLCYSVIAPMILVFSFLYFFIGWLVTRNSVRSPSRLLPKTNLATLCKAIASRRMRCPDDILTLTCVVGDLQALKVQVPEWESNGRMWPHIHNRFLGSLLVSQITALGYFAVQQFPYTVFLIFLPILTFGFYVYCKRNFYPSFAVVSLYVASQPVKETVSTNTIVEAYTPTCLLNSDEYEDAEFQDARSAMTSRSNSGITNSGDKTPTGIV